MTDPINADISSFQSFQDLLKELDGLKVQREQLYIQFTDIEKQLQHKTILKQAFEALIADSTLLTNLKNDLHLVEDNTINNKP